MPIADEQGRSTFRRAPDDMSPPFACERVRLTVSRALVAATAGPVTWQSESARHYEDVRRELRSVRRALVGRPTSADAWELLLDAFRYAMLYRDLAREARDAASTANAAAKERAERRYYAHHHAFFRYYRVAE